MKSNRYIQIIIGECLIIFLLCVMLCVAAAKPSYTVVNPPETVSSEESLKKEVAGLQEDVDRLTSELGNKTRELESYKKFYDTFLKGYGDVDWKKFFEYDIDYVLKVLYAEAGDPYCSEDLLRGVVTCLYNSCEILNVTPDKALRIKGYTKPYEFYDSRMVRVFFEVFVFGKYQPEIRAAKAEYFYAPQYMKDGYSAYHESLTYVITLDKVKFFTEVT